MERPQILIFGGTAAYHIKPSDFAQVVRTRTLETPYGPSPIFHALVTADGTALWFASRHGESSLDHSARFVNHRANLWAAQMLGVRLVLSWNGVGAINPDLRVGDVVVPEGMMDWTRSRINSFGEAALYPEEAAALRAAARTIEHINNGRNPTQVAHPFDPTARQQLQAVAADHHPRMDENPPIEHLTYVCTEGPRLETAAEVDLAAELGADMVGMTLCPEVWLAAELGLKYASLGQVTNFSTGRWDIDPRREFGPPVAERAMRILLTAADRMVGE
ncbi:MAG: MTAP family purine nucleoside phosphorylase [Candidatus Promineifilaceae bacterium]